MIFAIVAPRWLITIVFAFATAAGIGTGPAPIISSGSSGRIASSGTTTGQGIGEWSMDMAGTK